MVAEQLRHGEALGGESAMVIRALMLLSMFATVVGLLVQPSGVHAAPVSERFAVPRGTLVRWGGVVQRVDRRQSQAVVQIRGYPLGASGRPRLDAPAAGYFLAIVSSRIDAEALAPGALLTVTGRVSAEVESDRMRLPVLRAESRTLWPLRASRPPQSAPVVYRDPYRPYGYDPSLLILGSLAVLGALIATADYSSVHVGVGYGGYGYGHPYRYYGPRHHRGYVHYGVSAGYHH